MKTKELFEAPENDLVAQMEARAIAQAFAKWLVPKNEDTPLSEIDEVENLRLGKYQTYTVPAAHFGLPPEFHDLSIGFAKAEGSASAVLLAGPMENGKMRYWAVVTTRDDPGNDRDLLFGVRWPELIHELVHYLDRKRINPRGSSGKKHIKPKGSSDDGHEAYFNSPLEFNAYFQQGLHEIMNHIMHAKSRRADMEQIMRNYTNFRAAYISDFDRGFRDYMTDETKRRFEKRLFAFYGFIKTRWQDIQVEG